MSKIKIIDILGDEITYSYTEYVKSFQNLLLNMGIEIITKFSMPNILKILKFIILLFKSLLKLQYLIFLILKKMQKVYFPLNGIQTQREKKFLINYNLFFRIFSDFYYLCCITKGSNLGA